MAEDHEIIARVLGGDVDAFETLLVRYRTPVRRIVSRHVPGDAVEEVVQDAFVRAYRSLPHFRAGGGFAPWLSGIAMRASTDYWRRRYRDREVPESALGEAHQQWMARVAFASANDAFCRDHDQREAREVLDRALDRLTPEERMVIHLVYLEELSGKEAARQLGWSVANVKVRAFRARNKLRKWLSAAVGSGKENP